MDFAQQLEIAITESSYSYPCLSLTTESKLLRQEFEKFTDVEKEFYLSRHHVKGKWLPYNDLAKEWFDSKNGINTKTARQE
ncbi:hypothetical protein Q73A0000_05130 [Kaistella flava (ex Peng et al. 2021)]|uniref:Uncharacterized protein n=1 Tax=Kaistella flava (ex Peng et al. 2021) TaxID=2038776 RepID=A0A7M2Y8Y0_9FLAO|nr:hypothetical protein [Kaistella flava (ex Peng et al. 2021)]QOW09793.1 hypothetical protein Q73A0000_05130 [Kaistella flava (ex Peng et al. 2021)]